MQIYINKNGQQMGPFDEDTVIGMLATGEIDTTDHYIRQGDTNWQRMDAFFMDARTELSAEPAPVKPAPPVRRASKVIWLAFYLTELAALLLGILLLLIGGFGYDLLEKFHHFGMGVVNLHELLLFIGVVLCIQFLLLHVLIVSQLNTRLWAAIGLRVTRPAGQTRKAIVRAAWRKYRVNRWAQYEDHYKAYLMERGVADAGRKFGSLAAFGNLFKWGALVIPEFAKPFVFPVVISQGCDAINALPSPGPETIKEVNLCR